MQERGNVYLRFLDKYIGIPCVLFLTLFKKKRTFPKECKTVALLKAAGIGDVVLLSGIIATLIEKGLEVTLFTGMSNASMGKLIKGVVVIPLPMTRPLKALKKINDKKYDIWIDCDPWPRISALLSFFANSSWTIGFRAHKQYKHFLYDSKIEHSFSRHELDNYRQLLTPLHIQSTEPPFIQRTYKEKKKRIALHLFPGGSRAYLKTWPRDHWKQLIDKLSDWGYEMILTGSEKDREPLSKFMIRSCMTNAAGTLSLRQTAELLCSCAAVISVDTGIMHLAAALDCPVIALHGPTSPKRWGAIGKFVVSLTPQKQYIPCIQLGFESRCKHCNCMGQISVEQVLNVLENKILS